MSVRVVARIRPLLKLEIERDVIVTAESVGREDPSSPTMVRIPNPKNDAESFSFQFNSVYEQHATQQDIFDHEIAPTVKHLFDGYDTTIFAYGVTGTGKTHTMRGGKSLADRGVIPRLLSKIYREQRKIEKNTAGATEVEVAMSYYEIYNDKVFDLFEPPEKRTAAGLPIRDNNGKTVVVGLTERPCTTLKQFEQLYDQANVNRSTSATKLNAHSSRSHAVLCVKITQTTDTTVRISRASAIDLAGSEDNRRTDNNRERLVESSSINKSLFVLAQCVEAISKKQARIPYRESKMTRILSLGQNNGLTIMILNLAPVRGYHMDTLSSLNFANRTKKIEVTEIENEAIFRSDTKTSITSSIPGKNIQRQPLRPLASAHNIAINHSQKSDKPMKEFSVYSDSKKPARPSANVPRRSDEPQKRRADQTLQNRPSKVSRPTVYRSQHSEPGPSLADLEAIIDAKVKEKFDERARADQEKFDKMQRRIDETVERSGNEGLYYLSMAKQHQARGEETSALKMFQLAAPYFLDNEGLARKIAKEIAKVEDKIREKKALLDAPAPVPTPVDSFDFQPATVPPAMKSEPTRISLQAPPKRSLHKTKAKATVEEEPEEQEEDGSYFVPDADALEDDDGYRTDSSFQFTKPRTTYTTKGKSAPKVAIFRDSTSSSDPLHFQPGDAQPPTPRTTSLLSIINSRDVMRIRSLRGVGPKRAEAIVNVLLELEDRDIVDLAALAGLKGVGTRLVEGMRAGLGELDL